MEIHEVDFWERVLSMQIRAQGRKEHGRSCFSSLLDHDFLAGTDAKVWSSFPFLPPPAKSRQNPPAMMTPGRVIAQSRQHIRARAS